MLSIRVVYCRAKGALGGAIQPCSSSRRSLWLGAPRPGGRHGHAPPADVFRLGRLDRAHPANRPPPRSRSCRISPTAPLGWASSTPVRNLIHQVFQVETIGPIAGGPPRIIAIRQTIGLLVFVERAPILTTGTPSGRYFCQPRPSRRRQSAPPRHRPPALRNSLSEPPSATAVAASVCGFDVAADGALKGGLGNSVVGAKHQTSTSAALIAFCTHLPSDIYTLLGQAVFVVRAVEAEEADARSTKGKDDVASGPAQPAKIPTRTVAAPRAEDRPGSSGHPFANRQHCRQHGRFAPKKSSTYQRRNISCLITRPDRARGRWSSR
jgi:hypothetical protein